MLVAIGRYIPTLPANLVTHTVSERDRAQIGVGFGESADPWVQPNRLHRSSCLPAVVPGYAPRRWGMGFFVSR